MKSDEQLIELAKKVAVKNIKSIEDNKISVIEESFFGNDYKTITLPIKKDATILTRNGNKAKWYKYIYDPNNDILYSSRRRFIQKNINKRTFSFLTAPFIIIAILISMGYFYNSLFLALAFLLPIFYGYMIFGICYCYMKDYLKKFSDLVVITSGAITATLTIIPFLPFETFKQDKIHTLLINKISESNLFEDIIITVRILSIQAFICFYVIKLCIAFSETIEARKEYNMRKPSSTFMGKRKKSFKRWCKKKINILSMKYQDFKDKDSA